MVPIQSLDAVRIDGRFRLCYGNTETPALVGPNNPVDMFETVLDPAVALEGRRLWILQRREAVKPPGFVNKGQALRCMEMLEAERIEVIPNE